MRINITEGQEENCDIGRESYKKSEDAEFGEKAKECRRALEKHIILYYRS